jgi:hypothetical protein
VKRGSMAKAPWDGWRCAECKQPGRSMWRAGTAFAAYCTATCLRAVQDRHMAGECPDGCILCVTPRWERGIGTPSLGVYGGTQPD